MFKLSHYITLIYTYMCNRHYMYSFPVSQIRMYMVYGIYFILGHVVKTNDGDYPLHIIM